MKINKFFKFIVVTTICFVSIVMFSNNKSNAVLQSNGNTGAKYNLSDWMINVRKMESLGGAMGLSETVNSNLTSSNGSNNIDVHMQKNTEYGALAILSASSYGNPNKITDGATTTGNVSGVVMKLNKEWVAAALTTNNATYFKNASNRYKNIYNSGTNYGVKIGDAISETAGWHGSTLSEYIREDWSGYSAFSRAISGSIFSFGGHSDHNHGSGNGYHVNPRYSRAVIVQGEGI